MNNPPSLKAKRFYLSSSIALRLEKAIKEGRFIPGERLPSERKLSRELGISRPVLREALSALESRGFVSIQHGRGTFVTAPKEQMSPEQSLEWLQKRKELVHQFYEARLAIEPACAALASQRATKEQLASLQALMDETDQVVAEDNVRAFIGLDIDFHSAIAEMSGNLYLFNMLDSIIHPETDLRNVLHRLPGHLPIAHERHRRIIYSIAAGDAEGARQAMVEALEGPASDIKVLGNQKERE